MAIQAQIAKVGERRKRRKTSARFSSAKANAVGIRVQVKRNTSPSRTKSAIASDSNAIKMFYCSMYEQEERDIAKAVMVLEKYAR